MDHISLHINFNDRHDYRLLSVDRKCVQKLQRKVRFGQCAPSTEQRKRHRDWTAPSVVLALKGEGQLIAHDAEDTLVVRRVEYSNTLMLAMRAPLEESAASSSVDRETCSVAELRRCTRDVVVCALERMFSAHESYPLHNAVALLQKSYLTLDELEDTSRETTANAELYSFSELACIALSSPAQLAAVLKAAGAVVHKGRVRLLDPQLTHDVLNSVLTFLEGCTAEEATWPRVYDCYCPSVYPHAVMHVVRAIYGSHCVPPASRNDDVIVTGAHTIMNGKAVLVGLAGRIFETNENVTQHQLGRGGEQSISALPLGLFTSEWLRTIPSFLTGYDGIPDKSSPEETLLAFLHGYVISHKGRTDTDSLCWWAPQHTLPHDIAKRLEVLFAINPNKWEGAALQAYIDPLLAPDQTFGHVITRYAREYRIPGEAIKYSSLPTS